MSESIKKIFEKNQICDSVNSIEKIEIGFTNKVYLVNKKFILKICESEDNEENFRKENYCYNIFKNKLPVPKVLVFDESKRIYDKSYFIYEYIEGDNLYLKWLLLNDLERKSIIHQLCLILKTVNNEPMSNFADIFKQDVNYTWKSYIIDKIKNSLVIIKQKKLLDESIIIKIEDFVKMNSFALERFEYCLVYWDAHFDNILVDNNNNISGVLDFERVDIVSKDYILDVICRMQNYPKKYMNQKFEQFAKEEDYQNLVKWFEEFYPEAFNFQYLEKRLQFYSLKHDLDTLVWFPQSTETKKMIENTLSQD